MTAISFAVIFFLDGASPGIIPPQLVQRERYRACVAQASAPERVRVRVLRVKRAITWCPRRSSRKTRRVWRRARLEVTARVIAVDRSAVGLVRGRLIRFSYRLSHLCPRMSGPSNRPQPMGLSKGDVVWAFLQRLGPSGNRYALAASFLSLVRKRPRVGSISQWRRMCRTRYPRP